MALTNGQRVAQLSIPMFNGENYDFWYLKAKTVFRAQDLWELVRNGYNEPEEGAELTDADTRTLKETKRRDAKALAYIQQEMSEFIFPRIMRATTSNEGWEALREEFQGDTRVRNIKLQTLRCEFENLKDGESLKEYCSKVVEITNQMLLYGEVVNDKKKILISLTEKYDPIVSIILNIRELMASLQAHEQRYLRHSKKSIESALQSKLNASTKSQGESSKGGKSGRGGGRNQRGNSSNNSKQKCGICKRSNHVDKDCWFHGKPQCNHYKSLVMWRSVVDSRINNKLKSLKKKESKACSLQAVEQPKRKITIFGCWIASAAIISPETKVFLQVWMTK
ncbi:PREDICTED: uncharacterized protein LOC109243068 [Nicotiana attenuata]|uniref:uncharacterized protein LOC109243068 n=1 Tax=Nicotiana attenuata TaxID=49451 RepID=UPI000905BB75|nr:PREDICTED: uncharacterized protein LOC109243068 [Nicotiana attenuata]